MPYVLQGTRKLLEYWNILGRPCDIRDLSVATGIPKINFMGAGKDKNSFTATYGEVQAQNLAVVMGTTVNNINLSGDQVLI
jgi:hypothetical protein